MPLAVKLLDIPEALITDALKLELEAGAVIADFIENQPCVFLAGLYRAEQSIVSRLKALIKGAPPWPEIAADRGDPLGRRKNRPGFGGEPEKRGARRPYVQGHGHHRRPGSRQDDAGERDPADPGRQTRKHPPLRSDRPCGETYD